MNVVWYKIHIRRHIQEVTVKCTTEKYAHAPAQRTCTGTTSRNMHRHHLKEHAQAPPQGTYTCTTSRNYNANSFHVLSDNTLSSTDDKRATGI